MNEPVQPSSNMSSDERTWGMLCHLIALSGFIVPFGTILGPLIIWLIKKDEMAFVDDQGKESVNFQLTMLIGFIISAVLTVILIGFVLILILAIFNLVVIVIASVKANEGISYRYPYTIRFIK